MFSLDQFDYQFPSELIAQSPVEPRDSCRLLVLNRQQRQITHTVFRQLPELLDESWIIIRNNTKVLPARLFGRKDSGGKCEVLLIRQLPSPDKNQQTRWECLTKPGVKQGQTLTFPYDTAVAPLLTARCSQADHGYTRILEFDCPEDQFFQKVFEIGRTPLPPYIEQNLEDEELVRAKYQTTFAKPLGSVAAPTAGLHFTPELDQQLLQKGIELHEVTLHVGLGTFMPVQPEQLTDKKLHQEVFELSPATATVINQAKQSGKKILAVGTTTTRVLESCAQDGWVIPQSGSTELFLQPGDLLQVVDGLITNFHVPKSSLLMLVSAFTSAPNTSHPFKSFSDSPVGQAYHTAITERYRLFSFGDAMLIW